MRQGIDDEEEEGNGDFPFDFSIRRRRRLWPPSESRMWAPSESLIRPLPGAKISYPSLSYLFKKKRGDGNTGRSGKEMARRRGGGVTVGIEIL